MTTSDQQERELIRLFHLAAEDPPSGRGDLFKRVARQAASRPPARLPSAVLAGAAALAAAAVIVTMVIVTRPSIATPIAALRPTTVPSVSASVSPSHGPGCSDRLTLTEAQMEAYDTAAPGAVPTGGTLCRYGSLNQGQTLLGDRQVGARAAVLASLLASTEPVPDGTFHCPNDDGRRTIVRFTYPGGERSLATISETGCRWIGFAGHSGWSTDEIRQVINGLWDAEPSTASR